MPVIISSKNGFSSRSSFFRAAGVMTTVDHTLGTASRNRPGSIRQLSVSPLTGAGGAARDLWIDDLIVDIARVGCAEAGEVSSVAGAAAEARL